MKNLTSLLVVLCMLPLCSYAGESVKVDYDPPQRIDARFKLYKTENTWNLLELDTQTGKVWQLQFSIKDDANRIKMPINIEPLAKDGKPGRFTLYPTRNMYNFVLLDQETGKGWQVQFSTDNSQGIWPIDAKAEKSDTGWKQ